MSIAAQLRRVRRVATVVVPSALTAAAFVLGSRFGDVGDLPLWVLLGLLVVVGVVGETTGSFVGPDASALALHGALSTQILGITAIIYAIGWGPTLTIGYVFVVARALDTAGSRVWPIVLEWTTVGIVIGQIAIVVGAVPSYVPSPYVHGLALLGVLGTGFVIRLLGAKTAETECAAEQRDQVDHEVREALSLLAATLDATADGILVVDGAGAITRFNSQFAQMWRLPLELLERRDDAAAIQFVSKQLTRPDSFLAKVEELYADPEAHSDDTLEFNDGRVFDRHSRPQRVDGAVVGRVWSFRDVTDRSRLMNELEHQAFHDHLTGLANRSLLRDRLEHALSHSRRSGGIVAVLFCDLDGFKVVNDTLGHDAGDLLLIEVAHRIEHSLRDEDTAARLGGDEFAIVLDQTTRHDVVEVARRVLDALRHPVTVSGREVFARASIGIADNFNGALDADELLCRADIAMYAAKSHGRDRYEMFEPDMQTELAVRHELHGDLRQALHRDELVVHYQPMINLATQAVESFEALLRWRHPTRGMLGPEEYIPVAEETGLISPIGRFLLHEACRQTMEWQALSECPHLRINVNVSSHQLYDDRFVADVAAVLRETGLPPATLVLELSENTLLGDTSTVHERIEAFNELGVRVAIDDFGNGYSSRMYLHSLPVDYLKFGRTLVGPLSDRRTRRAHDVVRSIVNVAHSLSLGVVAADIEESRQLDAVRDAGCDLGQGKVFADPLSPEAATGWLRQQAFHRATKLAT